MISLVLLQAFIPCATGEGTGTTFSQVQCGYLDIDWQSAYMAVLEMDLDCVRIGAYWALIEREDGVYDFRQLDWQVEQAEKNNVPLVMVVGMKSPRWPEFYIPEWLMKRTKLSFGQDIGKNELISKRTLSFIKKVIDRYKDREIIRYWQVENEALNRFGAKYWYIGKELLKEEVALVRKLDDNRRPIILTAATYPNRLLRAISFITLPHDAVEESLKLCDILGVNIYPVIGYRIGRWKLYMRAKKKERDDYFRKIISKIKKAGKEPWITELQAEPWEPGMLVYKGSGHPETAKPQYLASYVKEFEELGFKTILLWGVEYWIYRWTFHSDLSWLYQVANLKKEER